MVNQSGTGLDLTETDKILSLIAPLHHFRYSSLSPFLFFLLSFPSLFLFVTYYISVLFDV